jgi:hypothetical protein
LRHGKGPICFQGKTKAGAKLKDPDILRHEKGLKLYQEVKMEEI